ncbi:MAG: chloride channel protein [Bacteriovoracaceae bacterium]
MFRKIIFSLISGLLAGLSSTLFLYAINSVTDLRLSHQSIIWFLPLAGLFIGWIYHHYGKEVQRGNNLIIDEIHDPKKTIPLIMAPFIFGGTLLTHLFGGSAGREGTAVQMGATLSDQLSKYFKLMASERKALLMSGAGAGFGAAIGTPWAGFVFGMEVIWCGHLRFIAVLECLVASWTAYGVTYVLHAPHSQYPQLILSGFLWNDVFSVIVAGIAFGVMTRFFIFSTHLYENLMKRWIKFSPLRPFIGGVILVLLYAWEGTYQYAGLGIEQIQHSLTLVTHFSLPILKSFFTTITLGSGFKGGEFIPLVFIGVSLGSALTALLPVSASLLPSIGFGAVFGAASKTPMSCTIMCIEIFGLQIGPYAFIGVIIAHLISGKKGIYLTQRL